MPISRTMASALLGLQMDGPARFSGLHRSTLRALQKRQLVEWISVGKGMRIQINDAGKAAVKAYYAQHPSILAALA